MKNFWCFIGFHDWVDMESSYITGGIFLFSFHRCSKCNKGKMLSVSIPQKFRDKYNKMKDNGK